MNEVVKTGEVTIKYEIRKNPDLPDYPYDWQTANGESVMYFKTLEEAEADVRGAGS